MAVTPGARLRHRHAWRHLIEEASRCASSATPADPQLGHRALDSRNWLTPSEDRGETAIFGAIGPMAYAYAKAATAKVRAELGPGLIAWCGRAKAILDRADPAPSPASMPFRADLDG